jgi:chemotaxis signal transduction protein
MATLLRSRRFADRAIEPTQQYITFQLRQYTFALPIDRLKRVSQLKGEADVVAADLSAPVDAREDVRWIDVDQRLFAAVSTPDLRKAEIAPPRQAVAILFGNAAGDTIGLAIDTQPKMQRIARSQISPLLEDRTDILPLQSVCLSQIQMEGENTIFLLDLEKLCNL